MSEISIALLGASVPSLNNDGVNDISGFLDVVYSRLDPETIYEGAFNHDWKKSKSRWRGKCPWHESKSGTAFYLFPDSLRWQCPYCSIGGGPIQYLYQVQGGKGSPRGKAFIDIARMLGDLAGVEFPEQELSPERRQRIDRIQTRQSILETVIGFCHSLLLTESKKAIDYLINDRGFTEEHIKDLQLGIFPPVKRIVDRLLESFKIEDLEDSHILYRNKQGDGYFSPLEGYIIVPWMDEYGRPLTLYGRWHSKTPPEGRPKTTALKNPGAEEDPWLKSKRSPLMLDRALADGHKDLIVVEGVFDAALLQVKGDSRVIAWVAANPSEEQIQTLKKHKIKSVTFCLDPDGAGDKGTSRGIERLSQVGIVTYVAPVLPDGLDPDEFVDRLGLEEWKNHIDEKAHGFRFMARRIVEGCGKPTFSDSKLQKVLEEAQLFADKMTDRSFDLSVYFWPEIQRSAGLKDLAGLSGISSVTTSKKKVIRRDRHWHNWNQKQQRLESEIDELQYKLENCIDPIQGLTEERFWKDLIGFLIVERMDALKAIRIAEERIGRSCPAYLKTC